MIFFGTNSTMRRKTTKFAMPPRDELFEMKVFPLKKSRGPDWLITRDQPRIGTQGAVNTNISPIHAWKLR